jgi:hypothetical protein
MTQQIEYAQRVSTPVSPLAASVVLGLLSLGLIALAGCFLIGVGMMYDIFAAGFASSNKSFKFGEVIFVSVLYVAAGACFVGAGYLLSVVVRRLTR